MFRTHAITVALAAASGLASGQLITVYTGDEGGDRSWFIDVETGEDVGGVLGGFRALATDPTTNRIFASSGRNLVVYDVISGEPDQDGSPRLVVDQSAERVQSITSFAWGNGQLYAYHTGLGDAPGGIYFIDVETRIETDTFPQVPAELILPLSSLPLPQPIDFVAEGNVTGLTFDTDRGELLIGVKKYEELDGVDEGEPGPADEFKNFIGNDILALDPATGEADLVVEVPFTLGEGGFDGMAYGHDRIFLDCGAPCGDISIYNRVTGEFEQEIGAPNRFGNGSGGAAFLEAVAPDAALTQRRVQINAIDFDAGIVEVFNFSNESQDLSGWRLCSHDFDQQRRYTSASGLNGVSIPGSGAMRVYVNDNNPPGDSSAINLSSLGGDFASPLDQDAFAIQLFFPDENGNVSFGNSRQIADHIQWNINGNGVGSAETRTAQAVSEGLWSAEGDFINTTAGTTRIDLADRSGDTPGSPGEYDVAGGDFAAFIVSSASDDGPGSLREAVGLANQRPGEDRIEFDPSLHGGTITLTSGQLEIEDPLSIIGPGADRLTVDAGGTSRIFQIADETLPVNGNFFNTISGLRLTGGNADRGGAIRAFTFLDVVACDLVGNSAANGGALFNDDAIVEVYSSTFRENTSQIGAAASSEDGISRFINSTFSQNTSPDQDGSVIFLRSTPFEGQIVLQSCTVAFNDAAAVREQSEASDAVIQNSAFVANRGVPLPTLGEANFTGDAEEALLGPLADNGGPTLTHLPSADSPLIDSGDDGLIPVDSDDIDGDSDTDERLSNDQRGPDFPRVVGGGIDIGAVETGTPIDAAPCNPADLAQPFGLLDGADVNAFISAFGISGSLADLNNDGTVDGADVNAFISAFGAGCP